MSKMKNIIRTQKSKEKPYVMLSKEYINNRNLSAKAKGIMTYILSLPDDWEIYVSELEKHFTDGRDAIASGLKELINEGYMTRKRKRNEKGHFKGYEYQVYEEIDDNPNKRSDSNITPINGLSVNGLSENGKPVTTNKELELSNDNTNNYIFPGGYTDTGKILRDIKPSVVRESIIRKNGNDYFLTLTVKEAQGKGYINLNHLFDCDGELIKHLNYIHKRINNEKTDKGKSTRNMMNIKNLNPMLEGISKIRASMLSRYLEEYFKEVDVENASIEHFIRVVNRIELQVV